MTTDERDVFGQIRDSLQAKHDRLKDNPHYSPWMTVHDVAERLHWSDGKTRYWLEKMVTARWLVWRWHPKRYGWHATKQYTLHWLCNFKPKGR